MNFQRYCFEEQVLHGVIFRRVSDSSHEVRTFQHKISASPVDVTFQNKQTKEPVHPDRPNPSDPLSKPS